MKIIIINLVLLMSIAVLTANIEPYSVENLKLTDINSLSLGLTTSSNGQFSNVNSSNSDSKFFDSKSNLQLVLSRRIANEKYDFSLSPMLTFKNAFQQTKSSYQYEADTTSNYYTLKQKRFINEYSLIPKLNAQYTVYFNSWFLKTSNVTEFSKYRRSHRDYESDSLTYKQMTDNRIIDNDSKISMGYGRLFSYKESYLAWIALKDMDQEGYLNRNVTAAEIDDLAKIMFSLQSVNNASLIDKNRKQLSLLMQYLKNSGFVKPEAEAKAMAVLLDTWELGENYKSSYYYNNKLFPDKSFGCVYEVEPFFNWAESKTDNDYYMHQMPPARTNTQNYRYTANGFKLGLQIKKPVHNVWLLNNKTDFYIGWCDVNYHRSNSFNTNTDNNDIFWKPYTKGVLDFSLTYFPGVRSIITTFYTLSFEENFLELPYHSTEEHGYYKTYYQDHLFFKSEIGINANYLISKNASLSARTTYTNDYRKLLATKVATRLSNLSSSLYIQYTLF